MDLEQSAFEALRFASAQSLKLYKQPLVITYSGGKDSDVLLRLAINSGIPFEALHSLTTADAPETVYHVRDTFRRLEEKGVKCAIDAHVQPDGKRVTMWNLIPQKLMPPTRLARYCCAILKEGGGKGRFIATGVRWAESQKRKSRGLIEVQNKENYEAGLEAVQSMVFETMAKDDPELYHRVSTYLNKKKSEGMEG